MTDSTDERTIEPIEKGDDAPTQIRKMRDSDLDLYIGLQVMVDLDKLKDELAIHEMTGLIIHGDEMQQLYKLAWIVLAWYERIPETSDDST